MDSWSTPFRLHLRDGRVWQGAEFANGFVCIHHPDEATVCIIAISLDGLLEDLRPGDPLEGANLERPAT